MLARPMTWLLLPILAGAFAVGCGGGSNSSSSGTTSAAPAATSSTPSSTVPTTSAAALQQAVTSCKQAVQAQSVLPAEDKKKLEAVCPNAAKGENGPVKKVAEEVCAGVINSSAVPAGPAREAALKACRAVK